MTTTPQTESLLLDIRTVSRLLAVSPATTRRLWQAGKLPEPVRLGALIRWDRRAIEQWIVSGCLPQK